MLMRCGVSITTFAVVAMMACGGSDKKDAGAEAEETGGEEQGETGEELHPTWHQDVAPLVAERCTGCHVEGGIAPFTLTDYETASAWAGLMADVTEAGTMPPFLAQDTDECEHRYPFKDDWRLDDQQKAILRAWFEDGTPEGDPATAAALPEPPSVRLEDPDLNLKIPTSVEVDGTDDKFLCYVLDPEITSEFQFLKSIQVNPGNDAIVHHVLVYSTQSEQAVAAD